MNNYFTITDGPKAPKTSELMTECKRLFPTLSYWNDTELDSNFPRPEKETTRYFKKQVEPDVLNVSYNDMIESKKEFMTFRERIMAELQYFKETGGHLDIRGWTVTSSRLDDGDVARAYWLYEFEARWGYAGHRDPGAGGREAVSLKLCDDSCSLETAKKIVEDAGYAITKKSWFITGQGIPVQLGVTRKSENRRKFLGSYTTQEEAEKARDEIRNKYGDK